MIKDSDRLAADLVEKLLPYLPPQSHDVKSEFEAGEYVAAAHGAIHDLGILRADVPEELLDKMNALVVCVETEDDSFNRRFISQMKTGILQLRGRHDVVCSTKRA